MSLSDANIFQARQLLKNFSTKKSTFIDNHRNCVQVLCLVGDKNEILVRYKYYGEHNVNKFNKKYAVDDDEQAPMQQQQQSPQSNKDVCNEYGDANWKLIVWFQKVGKIIQDLCFDASGRNLLVVCYDNTLHIVPILWIIDPEFGLKTTTSQEIENFYWPFRSDEITSFIVPFSGPHECSNSKTCPNNTNTALNQRNAHRDNGFTEIDSEAEDKYTPQQINEMASANSLYQAFYLPSHELQRDTEPSSNDQGLQPIDENESDSISVAEKSPDGCEKNIADFNASIGTCPYPLSVVWWSTSKFDEQSHQHRAIIGYSDGSICVVGLAPNCPFIANTSIDSKSGGILKMTICRDTIVKSISLLITSTSMEQWKLLLEQNSIGYIFPDEIPNLSPENHSRAKSSEEDWQFVIPINDSSSNSKCEDKTETRAEDADMIKDDYIHIDRDSMPLANGLPAQDSLIQTTSNGGIFPAARARLASLRDLGAKKIGALKLKLIENKIKSNEKDRNRQHPTQLACMHMPSFLPEILTTTTGPFFIAQFLKDTHLLSALHSYSDTLSVHSMDISLIPLYIYKIPKDCSNVLITPNIMYTKQQIHPNEIANDDDDDGNNIETFEKTENQESLQTTESHESSNINDSHSRAQLSNKKLNEDTVNAIGVIGCNATTLRIGEDSEFNSSSMLGLFPFPNEKIIDIHRVPGNQTTNDNYFESNPKILIDSDNQTPPPATTHSAERQTIEQPKVTTKNYIDSYSKNRNAPRKESIDDEDNFFNLDDQKVVEHVFPTIDLDQCLIVTDRCLYQIEFSNCPHIMFLSLVKDGQWKACEEFCKIFNLDFNQCIEYAGDVLLKKEKTTQALLTYNIAKIPPVKTALKLAMFGQNAALMHLCAMALKIVYVLRSSYPKNHTLKYVNEELRGNLFETSKTVSNKSSKKAKVDLNCGVLCSDFSYDKDETPGDLQMSNSSQFHLSNLLLLTLTEKAIKDKQLMPLWNFLVVNKRYHTNMSSIVLAQSGLYSSTIILALNRGAHMDAFCALVGVTNQEFGWYSEINEILYQLSDPIFMECIIYLQSMAMEYFDCIQSKCNKINQNVLERLRRQLDPFTPIFRPVVSQLSSNFIESDMNDLNKKLIEFCKHLIETFLIVIIKLYTNKCIKDEITNGLNVIYIQNEQNQFAIKVDNSSTIAAGFSHCAAIVDGSCYLWGSNGVNCALNCASAYAASDPSSETSPKCLEFISNMGLEVHAVKLGKAHTLIVTNNGLYAMGSNMQNQLGIGKHQVQALQPMLIPEFDGKNISLIEAGQYHNAVYADNELYTFGYGIYGQLGHGNIFTQDRPKIVKFFSNKIVQQIACGHAHTLVLTKNKTKSNETTLYFFGCNLFGQSGLGQYQANDRNQKILKTSVPTPITICNETIVQIHTKFFTNLIVTQNNRLYTWGASPQLIRLLNQARKRARLAQKFEETKNAITNDSVEKMTENIESGNAEESISQDDKKSVDEANIKIKSIPNSIECTSNERDLNGISKKSTGEEQTKYIDSKQVNLEDRIKSFLKSKGQNKTVNGDANEQPLNDSKSNSVDAAAKRNDEFYLDDEYTDHFYPTEVDTSEVVGEIVQVSSGLYHNVLITNTLQIYTWGKNLEKQLGRENPRCDLLIPTHLELNDNVISIDCGADFTLLLTDHYTVKAFGNNNVGQCGREMNLSNDRNGYAGKLVRLRVSKRVVRLPDTSQCIDQPMDVPLPRPKIRMNFDAVRYLKSITSYRPEFISREIFRSPVGLAELSPSSENFDENSSTPDADEQNSSTPLSKQFAAMNLSHNRLTTPPSQSEQDVTSEFIHYSLFILHGIYDAQKILDFTTLNEFKVRILMLNYYVKEAFKLCLDAAKDTISMHQSDEDVDLNSVMLTSYVIKLFEYFTKDASIVPIHRTDLKYLIHAIFMYFIENSLPMNPIEVYFLNNVDHYLFGLAFVLFFNNNNTKLERKVQQKYNHLFSGCASTDNGIGDGNSSSNAGEEDENGVATEQLGGHRNDQSDDELQLDFELIFKNVSTSFKTIVCQRLIEFDNELN